MPQSITIVSKSVAGAFRKTVMGIALGRNATLPRVGTHRRNTKRVNGRTEVRVRRGFKDGLKQMTTVADLRAHMARHLEIAGQPLQPTKILIFGKDNKTMHGGRHIV